MFDLHTLEQVLAPISAMGKDETSFSLHGVSFTLRALSHQEEIVTQRYAREQVLKDRVEGSDSEHYDALEFYYFFRVELLSYAIIQINELDFRKEQYIATGEVTPEGKPIRILKNVALRKIIQGWSRQLVQELFHQYGHLIQKLEEEATKAIQYVPSDLDTEIERLTNRLEELRAERERRAVGDGNLTAEQMASLDDAMAETNQNFDNLVESAQIRKPVTPKDSPPPSRTPFETIESSFGDIDDAKVRRAEEERIFVARQTESGLSGGDISLASDEELAQLGIPPQMRSPNISEEAAVIQAARQREIQDPALTQPKETLTGRGRGRAVPDVAINRPNTNQGRNLRFRPPK